MIECNYSYTYDFINKINSNSTKKTNMIIEIVAFIILLSSVILFVTGNKMLGFIFVGIAVVLIISVIFTRRAIAGTNQMLLNQDVKLIFDEDFITMETSRKDEVLSNAKFEYNSIKKVKQTKDMLYLFLDKVSCIVIPKQSFKSEKDLNTVLELVQNNYIV